MEEHDCKCGCLAMSKLRELIKAGPPRPGLVPQSGDPEHPGRWVRPEDNEPSEAKVRRGELWRTSKDDLFAHVNTNKIPLVGPQIKYQAPNKQDLIDSILAWEVGQSGETMKMHVTRALGTLVKGLELQGLTAGLNGLITKGVSPMPDAVPLEQLKGDLARAGHPVKRAIALDAQNRRLFFIDKNDTYLFAEYGSPEAGFSLGRVGSQSEVAKDYDPVDLEPEPRSDVKVEHGEEEQGDDPGFVPSGTPGIKPVDADGRGFGNTPKPTPTSKALQDSLDKVCGCLKDQGR